MKKPRLPCICLLLSSLGFSVHGQGRITFDELPETPLDGVTVSGVTFGFQGANGAFPVALFGTRRLDHQETSLLSAPWAAGSASGTLTITFAQAVAAFSFDAAVTGIGPSAVGYSVSLFANGSSFATFDTPTTMGGNGGPGAVSEARFSYSDPSRPVTSLVINPNAAAFNFIFDDLSYSVVPEPPAITLVFPIMLWLFRRRRPENQ